MKSYAHALYGTVTFLVTFSDLWRSFRWPVYCCYVCAVQLTRDLLAIANERKAIQFEKYLGRHR